MKNLKLMLSIAALVAGSTFALAFTNPPAHKPTQIEWLRTGSPTSPDGNTWVQGSTGTCEEATKICKADFVSGYNPNTHTYVQNMANATVLQDDGYVAP